MANDTPTVVHKVLRRLTMAKVQRERKLDNGRLEKYFEDVVVDDQPVLSFAHDDSDGDDEIKAFKYDALNRARESGAFIRFRICYEMGGVEFSTPEAALKTTKKEAK